MPSLVYVGIEPDGRTDEWTDTHTDARQNVITAFGSGVLKH